METAFQPPPCGEQSEPAFHRSFNYTWPYLQAAGEPLPHFSLELILNKSNPCVPARPVTWLWTTGPRSEPPSLALDKHCHVPILTLPAHSNFTWQLLCTNPGQKHEKNKYITKKITLNPSLFADSVYASLAQALWLHTKLRSVPWVAHKGTDRKVLPLIRCHAHRHKLLQKRTRVNNKMLLEAQPHAFAKLWEISVPVQLRSRRSASTRGWWQKSKPLFIILLAQTCSKFQPLVCSTSHQRQKYRSSDPVWNAHGQLTWLFFPRSPQGSLPFMLLHQQHIWYAGILMSIYYIASQPRTPGKQLQRGHVQLQ